MMAAHLVDLMEYYLVANLAASKVGHWVERMDFQKVDY
jgi:hypothetical protein